MNESDRVDQNTGRNHVDPTLRESEVTELISIASHQLRTPLASVRMTHQVILQNEDNNLTEEQIKLLTQAQQRIERMLSIVDVLLKLSSFEQSTTEQSTVPGALESMLDEAVDEVVLLARERDVRIQKNYDPAPRSVTFDRVALQDAVVNLLDNAIKYSDVGGVITLTTKYSDAQVSVTISDTGIGVPQGKEALLFQKLSRLDNAKAVDPHGLGLGLYITEKIVTAHRGEVSYQPNGVKGSVFGFTLPLRP